MDANLSRPSAATVRVELVRGASRFVACRAEAPWIARPLRQRAPARLFTGQLGGGYVAGDRYAMDLEVGAGAKLLVSGQASAKIYGGARAVSMRVQGKVRPGAKLLWIGEPLVPFAGSRYEGSLDVSLEGDASALVWESFTAGRVARGERWAFEHFDNSVQLSVDARLVLRDAVRLRTGASGCEPLSGMGSLVLAGASMQPYLQELVPLLGDGTTCSVATRGATSLVRVGVRDPAALSATSAALHTWVSKRWPWR